MKPPLTLEIGQLLTDVQAALIAEVQRRVHEAGYTDVRPTHDCVFRHLTPEGKRLRDLAIDSGMTPQAIGEHVDELERLGYIERVSDPTDRRAKLIRPTERGTRFMQSAMTALGQIEREWKRSLAGDTLTQLRNALAAVDALQRDERRRPVV
jgi:DNA-binding MarR family transcriptional regulator